MSRLGWILRIGMAAAIIAAASWYLIFDLFVQREDASVPTIAMVTSDDVNLRSGPGTSYEVLTVVSVGTEVAAETVPDSGFLKVSVAGIDGWISADYLSAPGSVIASSETVHTTQQKPLVQSVSAAVVEETPPPLPAPTAAPTYAPVIAENTQVEQQPQPGEKWIEVDRTNRTVTLHNGEIVVAQFDALIGKDLSPDGYYSTATGTFFVHVKEKSLVETPFAEGVYLTDFVGFDPDRSNGFHSPVRDEFGNVVQTGGTSTLGCVRLSESDAISLYNFAYVGMRVEIHD